MLSSMQLLLDKGEWAALATALGALQPNFAPDSGAGRGHWVGFNAATVLRDAVPAQLLQAAVRGESAGCEDFLPRLARFGGRAFGAFPHALLAPSTTRRRRRRRAGWLAVRWVLWGSAVVRRGWPRWQRPYPTGFYPTLCALATLRSLLFALAIFHASARRCSTPTRCVPLLPHSWCRPPRAVFLLRPSRGRFAACRRGVSLLGR